MSRKKRKEKKARKRQILKAKKVGKTTDSRAQRTIDKILATASPEEKITAVTETPEKKKAGRGRPKGSKNKVKSGGSENREPVETTIRTKHEAEVVVDPIEIRVDEVIREEVEVKKRGRKPLNPDDFREDKKNRPNYSDDRVMTDPIYTCYCCNTRKNQSTGFRVISAELAICKNCDSKK